MNTQGNTTQEPSERFGNQALDQPERFGNKALERLDIRMRTVREKLNMLTAIVAPLCRLPQEPPPEAGAAYAPGSAMAEQVRSLICLVYDMELRIDDIIERLEFGA